MPGRETGGTWREEGREGEGEKGQESGGQGERRLRWRRLHARSKAGHPAR